MILIIEDRLEESATHRWMTLGQIKALMRYDNIVNMDTRTVISCIPFSYLLAGGEDLKDIEARCNDISMVNSMTARLDQRVLTETFYAMNQFKQFNALETTQVDLFSMKSWTMRDDAFSCSQPYPFRVIFCDISIDGREVKHWTQPLFQATGIATFGLLTCIENGKKEFLVHLKPEIGCFDGIELGPSIQQEYSTALELDSCSQLFFEKLGAASGIVLDVLLSEEGGRFYHEQNRNVIVEIDKDELRDLPEGYFWMDYRNLNMFTQFNNCVNIQLRNLMSLLEV
jgi:oxidase EvaA